MALRVLLADESSTIKKAIQMALSDLGVDVKNVTSGLDVLDVCRSFLPDIILADILLSKKNGYDVCSEIKNNNEFNKIPVVLMWSSFMQLEQNLFTQVKADAALEKPFDTDTLRKLIEKFVPKTRDFPLKGLLKHPQLPDFVESDTYVKQRTEFEEKKSHQDSKISKQSPKGFTEDQFDEEDEFSEVSLKSQNQNSLFSKQEYNLNTSSNKNLNTNPNNNSNQRTSFNSQNVNNKEAKNEEKEDWSASSADQFIVETESYGDFEEVKITSSNTNALPNHPNQLHKRIQEQLKDYVQDAPLAKNKAESLTNRSLNAFEEQILKDEIKLIAEKICWQILPEMTEKIVREELSKLLNGLEK